MVSLASCRIGAVSAGGTNKGKKNKIMLSYFDKKVLFLKDENEKMVKTTRKIFTNGVNLSEI